MKTIFLFGNPDVPNDSLPLRILPKLRESFPDIQFEVKDPNEEWELPKFPDVRHLGEPAFVIIDTAIGVKDVTIFNDLKKFVSSPTIGMHDFDALANLRYLQKLGKLKEVTIIGIPPEMEEGEALTKVGKILEGIK